MQATKLFLAAVLICITSVLHSQTTNAFYKTLDDFANGKPLKGSAPVDNSWAMILGLESIKVMENGEKNKMSVKDFPAELLTLDGDLYRACEGKLYLVLVVGKNCMYAKKVDNADLMRSESITGEMHKFKEGWLVDILETMGLKEDYKKDKPKREFHDSVNDYFNKTVGRYIKYMKILNEKK